MRRHILPAQPPRKVGSGRGGGAIAFEIVIPRTREPRRVAAAWRPWALAFARMTRDAKALGLVSISSPVAARCRHRTDAPAMDQA